MALGPHCFQYPDHSSVLRWGYILFNADRTIKQLQLAPIDAPSAPTIQQCNETITSLPAKLFVFDPSLPIHSLNSVYCLGVRDNKLYRFRFDTVSQAKIRCLPGEQYNLMFGNWVPAQGILPTPEELTTAVNNTPCERFPISQADYRTFINCKRMTIARNNIQQHYVEWIKANESTNKWEKERHELLIEDPIYTTYDKQNRPKTLNKSQRGLIYSNGFEYDLLALKKLSPTRAIFQQALATLITTQPVDETFDSELKAQLILLKDYLNVRSINALEKTNHKSDTSFYGDDTRDNKPTIADVYLFLTDKLIHEWRYDNQATNTLNYPGCPIPPCEELVGQLTLHQARNLFDSDAVAIFDSMQSYVETDGNNLSTILNATESELRQMRLKIKHYESTDLEYSSVRLDLNHLFKIAYSNIVPQHIVEEYVRSFSFELKKHYIELKLVHILREQKKRTEIISLLITETNDLHQVFQKLSHTIKTAYVRNLFLLNLNTTTKKMIHSFIDLKTVFSVLKEEMNRFIQTMSTDDFLALTHSYEDATDILDFLSLNFKPYFNVHRYVAKVLTKLDVTRITYPELIELFHPNRSLLLSKLIEHDAHHIWKIKLINGVKTPYDLIQLYSYLPLAKFKEFKLKEFLNQLPFNEIIPTLNNFRDVINGINTNNRKKLFIHSIPSSLLLTLVQGISFADLWQFIVETNNQTTWILLNPILKTLIMRMTLSEFNQILTQLARHDCPKSLLQPKEQAMRLKQLDKTPLAKLPQPVKSIHLMLHLVPLQHLDRFIFQHIVYSAIPDLCSFVNFIKSNPKERVYLFLKHLPEKEMTRLITNPSDLAHLVNEIMINQEPNTMNKPQLQTLIELIQQLSINYNDLDSFFSFFRLLNLQAQSILLPYKLLVVQIKTASDLLNFYSVLHLDLIKKPIRLLWTKTTEILYFPTTAKDSLLPKWNEEYQVADIKNIIKTLKHQVIELLRRNETNTHFPFAISFNSHRTCSMTVETPQQHAEIIGKFIHMLQFWKIKKWLTQSGVFGQRLLSCLQILDRGSRSIFSRWSNSREKIEAITDVLQLLINESSSQCSENTLPELKLTTALKNNNSALYAVLNTPLNTGNGVFNAYEYIIDENHFLLNFTDERSAFTKYSCF
ncbi:MAG: hypothetical protein Q8R83_02450 [Legionellaceae bacterium]|nr:hypothetical protein [Legionellaceae bacterium]